MQLLGAEIGRGLECLGSFGRLDLRGASAGEFLDCKESWPKCGKLSLDGFTYGRFTDPISAAHRLNAADRLEWLKRVDKFTRQPYRQVAHVLRQDGDYDDWRKVCVEMERDYRKGGSWRSRVWSWILRNTIGYGYFSERAFWWLMALVATGWVFYWSGYKAGSLAPTSRDAYESFVAHKGLPAYYEAFCPFAYSLENSFPLVNLGIQDKWAPAPDEHRPAAQPANWPHQFLSCISSYCFLRWFRWIQICLGWLFATLFVVGVTGVVRKD